VPAAAVIPGPIVYIEFVAVKKFVVGSGRPFRDGASRFCVWRATLRKLECSKQAVVCIIQHRIALSRWLVGCCHGMVNRSRRGRKNSGVRRFPDD
jgi:hypothetical protein